MRLSVSSPPQSPLLSRLLLSALILSILGCAQDKDSQTSTPAQAGAGRQPDASEVEAALLPHVIALHGCMIVDGDSALEFDINPRTGKAEPAASQDPAEAPGACENPIRRLQFSPWEGNTLSVRWPASKLPRPRGVRIEDLIQAGGDALCDEKELSSLFPFPVSSKCSLDEAYSEEGGGVFYSISVFSHSSALPLVDFIGDYEGEGPSISVSSPFVDVSGLAGVNVGDIIPPEAVCRALGGKTEAVSCVPSRDYIISQSISFTAPAFVSETRNDGSVGLRKGTRIRGISFTPEVSFQGISAAPSSPTLSEASRREITADLRGAVERATEEERALSRLLRQIAKSECGSESRRLAVERFARRFDGVFERMLIAVSEAKSAASQLGGHQYIPDPHTLMGQAFYEEMKGVDQECPEIKALVEGVEGWADKKKAMN